MFARSLFRLLLVPSPLTLVATAFALGLLAGAGDAPARALAWLALGGGGLLAYAGRVVTARGWGLVLMTLAALAGLAAAPRPRVHEVPRGLARFDARVESVRHGRRGPWARVRVEAGARLEDDAPLPVGAWIAVPDLDAPPGSRVRLLARLRPETVFRNPSPHPPWLRSRPLSARARLAAPPRVEDAPHLAAWLHDARAGLRHRLDATLPPRAAGVARALLLGDGAAVRPEERDAIRGAGLAHLLAVSGLHVALLVGAIVWLATAWARGRAIDAGRFGALAGIPVALGFALVAGGAPSVWRAATMACLALGLRVLRRRPRGTRVAAAAVLVFAAASPEDAVRPAFLLSIAATAAIVTAPGLREAGALRAAWDVSARTTVATAPLVLWCFGQLPPGGVVANVLLVPLATLALVPLAFAHALLASVGLGELSAPLFTGVLDALVAAAEAFAQLGGDALSPPSVAQGVVLAAMAFVGLAARGRRRVAVLLLGALALGAAEIHLRHVEQPRGALRVTFADVAQGDGALVDLPDGSALLVDAGGGVPDPGERSLAPLLAARRRDRLALVILSHPHPDHYAGLRALLDAGVEVGAIWDSGQAEDEAPHGPAARLLRSARRRGIPVRTPAELCGAPHRVGGATLELLWPCPTHDPGYGPNDNSLVVRVRHGARSVLFTGDVEALAEEALVASELDLAADVLKVPHHGSRTSSSEAFLRRVAPRLAVFSCGRQSRYGHPHDEVVARYRSLELPLLGTPREGGVVVTLDDDGIRWRSWREDVPQALAPLAPSPGGGSPLPEPNGPPGRPGERSSGAGSHGRGNDATAGRAAASARPSTAAREGTLRSPGRDG